MTSRFEAGALGEAIRRRAAEQPDHVVFTFVGPSREHVQSCTFHELDVWARGQSAGRPLPAILEGLVAAASDPAALASAERLADLGRRGADMVLVSALSARVPFGRVAGVLLPIVCGGRAILLAPSDDEDPVRWLEVASAQRATTAIGSGRTLERALAWLTDDACDALDLSCLELLWVAGEPLRSSTLGRFAKRLGRAGLRRDAIVPLYVHDETGSLGSDASPDNAYRACAFEGEALARGRVVARDGDGGRSLVSRGRPAAGLGVRSTTGAACAPDEVGEITIAGVATGDLGFVHDGELFVVGRSAELLELGDGRYDPTGFEQTAERADARVRRSGVVAFAAESKGARELVMAVELEPRDEGPASTPDAYDEIATAIARAVSTEHGVVVARVIVARDLVGAASAAVAEARADVRERYRTGSLPIEHAWENCAEPARPAMTQSPSHESGADLVAALRTLPDAERTPRVEAWLRARLGGIVPNVATVGASEILDADSLTVLSAGGAIQTELGISLSTTRLFVEGLSLRTLTSAVLAALAEASPAKGEGMPRSLVELTPLSVPTPLFLVAGVPGATGYLSALARALGSERAIYALQAPGLDGTEPPLASVDALADRYAADALALQPSGPYLLAGHSFGGILALEVARRLRGRGEIVAHVGLIDTSLVEAEGPPPEGESVALVELLRSFTRVLDSPSVDFASLDALPEADRVARLRTLVSAMGLASPAALTNVLRTYDTMLAAMLAYRPEPWDGPLTLYRARGGYPADALHPARKVRAHFGEPLLGWDTVATTPPDVLDVDGDHFTMITEAHVASLAAALRSALNRAGRSSLALPLARLRPAVARARGDAPGRRGERPRDRRGVSLDDVYDPTVASYPFDVLGRLRDPSPVARGTVGWLVTGHAECMQGLRDRRLSSDNRHQVAENRALRVKDLGAGATKPSLLSTFARTEDDSPLTRLFNNALGLLEPPRHTRLRDLLAGTFHPTSIERWRAPVERHCAELLEAACARREADVMRDVAIPLPLNIASEILGIPAEERPMVRTWINAIVNCFDPIVEPRVYEEAVRAVPECMAYVEMHVDRRRRAPTDDLLGLMCRAEVAGDRLTRDELIATTILLFIAGFETTTNTIGNLVLALFDHPEQYARLAAQPALANNAIEELLRYDGTFKLVLRTAVEDVELGGCKIRSGESVYFLLPAANRDPRVFANPDAFDVSRPNAKSNLAFGHGRHYCIGAALARLEIATLLELVMPLLPRMTPRRDEIVWSRRFTLRGMESFPIAIAC